MHGDPITATLIALIYLGVCVAAALRPRAGVQLLIVGAAIIHPYPGEGIPWDIYAFVGLGSALITVWLIRRSLSRRVQVGGGDVFSAQISRSIAVFVIICLASFPVSMLFNADQPVGDRLYFYLRGLLPFTYLMVFFVIRDLNLSARELRGLGQLMFGVCAAYAPASYWAYLTSFTRITQLDSRFTFPFTSLAADLAWAWLLYSNTLRAAFCWAALFLFLAGSILPTFTKAQMLSLLAGILLISVLAWAQGRLRRSAQVAVLLAAAVGVSLTWAVRRPGFVLTDLASTWTAKLQDTSSQEVRVGEIRIAIANFLDDPLLGKGLGFQYVRSMYWGGGETVGYVHNMVAYMLMTMGVVGLAGYLWIFWVWLKMVKKSFHANSGDFGALVAGVHGQIFSLFVFSLMFASFRTMEHNVFLAAGLALACGLQRPRGRGEHTAGEPPGTPRRLGEDAGSATLPFQRLGAQLHRQWEAFPSRFGRVGAAPQPGMCGSPHDARRRQQKP
jgi:hypothetical protein